MKILNFGSLNIDYTYLVDHFVRAGETLASDSLEIFCGGKGLNQSIALKRSGVDVWHAGALGESDGEILLTQLETAGVDTTYIQKLKDKTGHAMIQKDGDGQNCILLYGGANQSISKSHVDHVLEDFDSDDFILLQNEISEVGYIMEQAHKKSMKIVLNPSPINQKIFEYPLNYVDYFLLNEIEAEDICKRKGTGEEMLGWLSELFPEAKILLTLGQDGALYKDGNTLIRQHIYKVPVVDTTAAGDTFTGYFVGGLAAGEPLKQALDNAAKASAIAVSRSGASPSIPTRSEIEQNQFL